MQKVRKIDPNLWFLDIYGYLGAYLLRSGNIYVIIDGGYPAHFPELRDRLKNLNLDLKDISYFIATHVHLDHAGFAGLLARENPKLKVLVHEIGARYLKDPTRLNESAKKAYGDSFKHVGEVVPIPEDQLIPVKDGDSLELPNTILSFHHTPGHAKHHVVILDEQRRFLFTGDAVGNKVGDLPLFPTTPPADYDLNKVLASLDKIEALKPERLLFTHHGPAPASETSNLLQEARNQHVKWVLAVQEELKRDPSVSNDELLERLKSKIPAISKYPIFLPSCQLNVAGIRLSIKRRGEFYHVSQ
ncbi:MAG: MBL fold metallo-hydrolase [Candidatus Helarchaeales archaeon]